MGEHETFSFKFIRVARFLKDTCFRFARWGTTRRTAWTVGSGTCWTRNIGTSFCLLRGCLKSPDSVKFGDYTRSFQLPNTWAESYARTVSVEISGLFKHPLRPLRQPDSALAIAGGLQREFWVPWFSRLSCSRSTSVTQRRMISQRSRGKLKATSC